jgi:hypothetical protein
VSFAVVGPAIPLFVVGDSHTVAYSDLLFEYAGTRYITRAKYCRGVTAQTFTNARGELHPALVEALASELLVTRTPDGLLADHRILGDLAVGIARERTRTAPVICIFAGDVDLRTVFLDGFTALDFELRDAPPDRSPESNDVEKVPYRVVRAYAERLLEPLFAGLRALAELGFKNLYLHSLPPPTVDDDLFERLNGFRANVSVRYKATYLFNRLLAEFAQRDARVRYVDLWPATTLESGVLNPEFALDGTHLNRRAAALTVEYILTDLERRRSSSDDARYRELASAARGAKAAEGFALPDVRQRFAAEGLLHFDIGPERAERLRSLVKTGRYQIDAPPPGWAYDPLEPNSGHRSILTIEFLRELATVVYATELRDALAACFGYDPTLLNVRLFHSVGNEKLDSAAPAQFAPLAFPPDVFRGALYLDDCTDISMGPLVVQRDGQAAMIFGSAGMLLVFDPHRIPLCPVAEVATRANNLDLVFGPRLPGTPARVIAAPGNALWPIDPNEVTVGDSLVVEVR